jgi:hypothetical protein
MKADKIAKKARLEQLEPMELYSVTVDFTKFEAFNFYTAKY